MPIPANDTGIPTTAPPPDLSGVRTQQVQPPESTFQTVKRNMTPELDTSRAALGPGHMLDSGDSPQQTGEAQYREQFGSPLERAYGHLKNFLATHEQRVSEKYLVPFREGLDRMGEDLQHAGESGHTKSGGALTQPTRALAGGVGAALKLVPVGRDIKETAAMSLVPPELGPEGKALSKEIKAGERAAEGAPNLTGIRTRPKELPPQPRLPDTGTHAAIKTDDGAIYFDDAPEKQRTHVLLAKDLGIPPERIVSGGWLQDGSYEASERSDAGRWGEQARAKAAVAEKRTAAQNPASTEILYHGSPDVSKIDSLKPGKKGGYFGDGIYLSRDPEVARRFTKLEGMNPTLERNADGSFTDINTGKRVPAGTPGLLKTTLKDAHLKHFTIDEMEAEVEKFRQPNGVIDLDAARNAVAQKYAKQGYDGFDVPASKNFDEPQVVIFPSSAKKLGTTAEAKARERAANLKGLGIGLTKMNPADAKNWVEYTNQKTLKVYRGVADPSHTIEPGDFVTTSKESAQNYGEHVQEIEVSPSELRYVRGHKDGDPKLLDIGGQTELVYAPKKKAAPQSPSLYTPEGAQPLAEKLGAKVVGSAAKKGATPKDLDLRIEGEYKADEVTSKLKAAGFEPRGSSVLSPKEIQASGKPYGRTGWKRAEHFENAAGQKIDVWHDEPEGPDTIRQMESKSNAEAVARNRPQIAEDNLRRAKEWGVKTTAEGNLVLYHGTRSGEVIRSSGKLAQGSYLAADEKTARQYAEGAAGRGKAEVIPVEVPAGTVLGNGEYFSANEEIPYKPAQIKERAASRLGRK